MNKKIISFLFIAFLLFPKLVYSVYFASDTVHLYKNGRKLHDNAIYLVSYKSHSEKCPNGVCVIGQQFYPVTIHLPKRGNLLTYAEYSSENPYSGPKRGPEAGKAIDDWSSKNKQNYLKYLKENSRDIATFNPDPSEGGEGCGYPGCIGGRIGDDRNYNFDIATGKFSQNNQTSFMVNNYRIYILGAFCLIFVILFATRKIFKN